jgi:hypothetical protein
MNISDVNQTLCAEIMMPKNAFKTLCTPELEHVSFMVLTKEI